MAFRADESAQANYSQAESYLVPRLRDVDETMRARCKTALAEIVDELGPVVDAYPSWHPLVSGHNERDPITVPNHGCGYKGLDHTVYFAHGFITCPHNDGQEVIDSVRNLPYNPAATIIAERLDVPFYHPHTTSILVRCDWDKPLPTDKLIPLPMAMPLLLEKELPCWRYSEVAETWETMRRYFLGAPHGSRSSLFVSQETGQAMKKVWEALIYTGMFGPIMVG